MKKNKLFIALISATLLVTSVLFVRADEVFTNLPSSEVIIGTDDRQYLSDTTSTLNKKMVRITFEGLNEHGQRIVGSGSGVMISKDIVLTAAHCVYNSRNKEYYQNVKVVPSATWNGETFTAPLGYSVAQETEVLSGYLTGDSTQDIGVIKLQSSLGNQTGYLEIAVQQANVGQYIKTIGYPGDRLGMYLSEGKIISSSGSTITYNLDTSGGQSGSPILNEANQIIAIHYAGNQTEQYNIARLITPDVQQLIESVNSTSGAVYRVYNPNSGWHHYTSSLGEKNHLVSLGWKDEGIAWEAGNNVPVHRLYNPNNGHHFYTTNTAEKDSLVATGWKYENIAFYSGDNLEVFRLYNPNTGEHFYTVNYLERNHLIAVGWGYEGVAFKTK
ncbi:trypsin-like peptidase domain-containing protein [Streptococcus suis]|uniref:trypsin-like peptidase domain-containing protein n=1 Tax=Streptococcus suis TaxID=1307 RepID=UPI00032A4191|nr:trypsin-like peptidase domain-containing protein [Streptococcus suis]AGL47882.1 Cell wall surface anchor family protein [Streptococcus suis TL13]HEL1630703.1 trypsin-like peptidase domain-containing protein [Streptococcus suis]HEL1964204.1 trypsin-like peptidase domain-containing protein [Streptococcus suis]HEL1966218.1 trypsin-like peptidase domain-containing protein [Streptococcus suis]HEL1982938.1 trypsin-like peptidase domain-containing protein [Streptococcus suis]